MGDGGRRRNRVWSLGGACDGKATLLCERERQDHEDVPRSRYEGGWGTQWSGGGGAGACCFFPLGRAAWGLGIAPCYQSCSETHRHTDTHTHTRERGGCEYSSSPLCCVWGILLYRPPFSLLPYVANPQSALFFFYSPDLTRTTQSCTPISRPRRCSRSSWTC